MGNSSKVEWHNLSLQERRTLEDLARDESSVIKEADKGGAIVVLNTANYHQELKCELSYHVISLKIT